MQHDSDLFAYMMAAEKISSLIFLMEQSIDFMDEYQIEADEEVKKALSPILERFNKWVGKG